MRKLRIAAVPSITRGLVTAAESNASGSPIAVGNSVYPIAVDSLKIARRVFGPQVRTFQMAMSTNPADKARRRRLLQAEPVFVFRK